MNVVYGSTAHINTSTPIGTEITFIRVIIRAITFTVNGNNNNNVTKRSNRIENTDRLLQDLIDQSSILSSFSILIE